MDPKDLLIIALDPENPNFQNVTNLINEMIMNKNIEFLKSIFEMLTNHENLEPQIAFVGLSILLQYFKNSTKKGVFDDFPTSEFNEQQINDFQRIAFRFFDNHNPSIRNEAAELFFLAYQVDISNNINVIPDFMELLVNEKTSLEIILSCLKVLNSILQDIELSYIETALFKILMHLMKKYYQNFELNQISFEILSQFCSVDFKQDEDYSFLILKINELYQFQFPELKVAIIHFLDSSYFQFNHEEEKILFKQLLPFFKNDLENFSHISLTIFDYFADVINRGISEEDVKSLCDVLLSISASKVDDIIDIGESEMPLAAQIIFSHIFRQSYGFSIFLTMLQFLMSNVDSSEFNLQFVSLQLLAFGFQSINPGQLLYHNIISIDHIKHIILTKLVSEFTIVRFACLNFLISTAPILSFDFIEGLLPTLFSYVEDCEVNANLAAAIIQKIICANENFNNPEYILQYLMNIINNSDLINNNPNLISYFQILSTLRKFPSVVDSVVNNLFAILNTSLTTIFNKEFLNKCISMLEHFLEKTALNQNYNCVKSIIFPLYQKYLLGSEVVLLIPYIESNFDFVFDDIQKNSPEPISKVILDSINNFDRLFGKKSFISFLTSIATHTEINSLGIDHFLFEKYMKSQSFDIMKELCNSLVYILQRKPELFRTHQNEICQFLLKAGKTSNIIFQKYLELSIEYFCSICNFAKGIIELFDSSPHLFALVNQLIGNLLDIGDLLPNIRDTLKSLFDIFSQKYASELLELQQKNPIYTQLYSYFNSTNSI